MAGQSITVDDLASQVRSLLDEDNRESVTDNEDILPALNRAQNYASNILARHYESPLLTHEIVPMVTGEQEYVIPEEAFEQRLEKVEVRVNNLFYPMTRISYRDLSLYETSQTTAIPDYYAVVGNKYRIIPQSNATYSLRVWYLVDPLPLVLKQGRINTVSTTDNYVVVDSVGSSLTTEADNLDSYVNIIDAQTGVRKASYQVKNIIGNKVLFKTTPARTNVLNIPIDTTTLTASLLSNQSSESADISINPDDFVCILKGSCVPFFKKPFTNFLVQYAVAEIRRKLGGPADLEQRVLEKLEQQVERSWVGRESTLRVTKKNSNWNLPTRRYWGVGN